MHQNPGNVVATGLAVVYYAGAARAFRAGIKYRHCRIKLVISTARQKVFLVCHDGLHFSASTHQQYLLELHISLSSDLPVGGFV